MRIPLVRHASAGDRRRWEGDDGLRPLDEEGRRQAEALAGVLAELGTQALHSSPSLRCVQTLEPASALLGLPIETRHELAEDARRDDVLFLVESVRVPLSALCTHREVIEELLPGFECEKGGIWVVEVDADEVRPERYLPAPN
jgi:phosphohistidine phosphatase SixA